MYLAADELSSTQFAEALGVPVITVQVWCRLGRVTTRQTPGGRYRIPRSEIERVRSGLPLP